MIDQAGLWAGTGILCAMLVLLIIFAMYKQYSGTLALPPRKPEAKPDGKTDGKTEDKTEQGKDQVADGNSAKPPPPYPSVDDGPAAYTYDQPVDDGLDGVDVAVEVHGTEAACAGREPEASVPYVYDQAIQLETST
ncbi:uncharacterized protein LOC119739973 [Patiria miniata]|uniref:Uncharacterized protein n=1 Tax=Patiria miniata TaxID=46514 RepID=A0A914B4S2_PATMI|nr:uncharacterized protein LOC119739973 [Patiria miniata]XP_038071068.1 uncharacterized protein LOC119739973 [Patiria miniata]